MTSYMVCLKWDNKQHFKDNQREKCTCCGTTVMIRPYNLILAKKHNMMIACVTCVTKVLKDGIFGVGG